MLSGVKLQSPQGNVTVKVRCRVGRMKIHHRERQLREREIDRDTERERERGRQREGGRERERQRGRERERERERWAGRQADRQTVCVHSKLDYKKKRSLCFVFCNFVGVLCSRMM